MIDALKRTLVGTCDLSEQEPADYILLVGGQGGRAYYYIDDWKQVGDNMEFYRLIPSRFGYRRDCVYVCRQEGQWGVIAADLVEPLTGEELMRVSKKDSDAFEALTKELDPQVPDPNGKPHGVYL